MDYYEHMDTQNTEYPKALLRLAKAEERNKNYEESVAHHKQAMKLFEEHGMYQDYSEAASSLKICYMDMG